MPNRSQKINDYTETSTSSPKRTRPTDRQMGLGSRDILTDKAEEKKNKAPNT